MKPHVKLYKSKLCKWCKGRFTPTRPIQGVCSPACAIAYGNDRSAKKRAKDNKKALRDMMTKGDHLKELQAIFNRFIRLRDKDLSCISCGTKANVQFHAGHFYSVGAYPNLRFNEDNVHRQCGKNCNKELSGNVHEYAIRLKEKIGIERFEALSSQRSTPLRLSIPEIIELKTTYKNKIKELKRQI